VCDPDQFAFEVLRGTGIDGRYDGYIYKNLLASYTHMRNVGGNDWVERFIKQVHTCSSMQPERDNKVSDV
jgi:cobyrinic acid a,c-diamide synthase